MPKHRTTSKAPRRNPYINVKGSMLRLGGPASTPAPPAAAAGRGTHHLRGALLCIDPTQHQGTAQGETEGGSSSSKDQGPHALTRSDAPLVGIYTRGDHSLALNIASS
jgi:hypothetical protein